MPAFRELTTHASTVINSRLGSSLFLGVSHALTLLDFQDQQPLITKAAQAEQTLLWQLNKSYEDYILIQDKRSAQALRQAIAIVIEKLARDRAIVLKRAQETSQHLHQKEQNPQTDAASYGLFSLLSGFKGGFNTWLGSRGSAQKHHYNELAEKYAFYLQELILFRDSLPGIPNSTHTSSEFLLPHTQPRLLQTTSSSFPITHQQYCYPTGVCDLSQLSDGVSGFVLQGEAAGDRSGYSVHVAGDINGDGLVDFMIGAYEATPSAKPHAGKTYVLFGSNSSEIWSGGVLSLSSLMNGRQGFVLQGEAAGDFSSWWVSTAGDINGDGLADIMIGAPTAGLSNKFQAGKIFVIFGSVLPEAWGTGVLDLSNLMDGRRGFVLQGESAGDLSGYSASVAGDINGDGLADMIVGALHASPEKRSLAGKTYILFGSNVSGAWDAGILDLGNLIDGHRGFVLQGETANERSGYSVSTAGDINGDGLIDLMVGAPNAPEGKTYILFGSNNSTAWGSGVLNLSTLMDGERGFVLQGEAVNDNSGVSVSTAGDINGDGLSDLMVGACGCGAAPESKSNAGKTYILFGSNNSTAWGTGVLNLSDFTNGQRGFVLQGEAAGDLSGRFISTAGDINGDGLSDLMVAAENATFSGNRIQAGKTYILFGSNSSDAWGIGTLNLSNLMDGRRGFALQGEEAGDHSGYSISSAGDINGDGLADLMVGAYAATPPGKISAGKTYVVFGAPSPVYFTANYLNINVVGEVVYVTSQFLALASAHSHININTLQVIIKNLDHGSFSVNYVPTDKFYMQNVSDGMVRFEHKGGLLDVPQYRVVVNLSPSLLVNSVYSDAHINFLVNQPTPQPPSDTDYEKLFSRASSIGGPILAVLSYLWYRRLTAQHRNASKLPSALRKILNLEYHDFMRFGGNMYKQKIDEFLQSLQSKHPQFYDKLKKEEKRSFAVCMSQVLKRRGLASLSNYSSGLYGLLFLLSTGWSFQLDLERFEEQREGIIKDVITRWRNSNQPVVDFPYDPPNLKDKIKAFCCAIRDAKRSRKMLQSAAAGLPKNEEGYSSLEIEPLRDEKASNAFENKTNSIRTIVKRANFAEEGKHLLQKSNRCLMM